MYYSLTHWSRIIVPETGNVDAVLDGGLDIFINGYLKWISVQGDKKNTEN